MVYTTKKNTIKMTSITYFIYLECKKHNLKNLLYWQKYKKTTTFNKIPFKLILNSS